MKAVLALLLAASLPAVAQNLEARRYRTAEGIEVLTGRPAPASSAPAAAQAVPAPLPPAVPPAVQGQRVPAAAQAERDRDRLAILNAELMTEGKALADKRRALASPRVALDLTSEQLQALRDSIAGHEENIRALTREIRRLPAAAQSVSLNSADSR